MNCYYESTQYFSPVLSAHILMFPCSIVLGIVEGCYTDWSLDLLIARKVSYVLSFVRLTCLAAVAYIFLLDP